MKTIYFNGNVYTGGEALVSAFAVENGKFVFAGSDAEAKTLAAEGDTLTDLDGKFVCAGFNDSHMHLLNYGASLGAAKLAEHTGSLTDLQDALRDFLAAHPRKNGAWLRGRGWNQDYFTDVHRMPDRYDLDKVSTEVPILITRACGHCLVVNSKALELLPVSKDTPQPEGGRIGLDENGELDGRFYDNAMDPLYESIKAPDREELKEMMLEACKELNRYGVTSSQTDDYCVYRSIPYSEVNEAYKELEAEGKLTVRVYEQCNFTEPEQLQQFLADGNMTGKGTDRFKIGPLKLLGDGALGGRTAYLSKGYADDPGNHGFPLFSKETMQALVSCANAAGMQIATHAIGDACLDMVLDCYENALKEHPRTDHRHGIVHCQASRADQLERIEKMNLHVYAQSIFLDYDNHIVEQRLGKELASTSYNWKTLKDHGVSVSNGTDCPVELPDALAGMQCAVTRTSLHDHVGPYLPEQAFSVKEALDSYTIESAKGSFEENVKGRIAPGYLADFVVLGENLFTISHDSIKDVPVLATYVGGECVYKK